jgi:alpha-L-fucosidase 2
MRGETEGLHSQALNISYWARLLDGSRAHKCIVRAIADDTSPNFVDADPAFRISGNIGAMNGICEMLMQSHAGVIDLLPALPDAWPDGMVKGLSARGGVTVNIKWKDGKLIEVALSSPGISKPYQVRYRERTLNVDASRFPVQCLNGALEPCVPSREIDPGFN